MNLFSLCLVLLLCFFSPVSASEQQISDTSSLEQEIESISEGTDLIASGYFEDGYDTVWLLFDNQKVIVLLRDMDLPDIHNPLNQEWRNIAPLADVYLIPDNDHKYYVPPNSACKHDYICQVISEPTKENDGKSLYICSICHSSYTITTYYQEEEFHYYLTAVIDGQEVQIEITEANRDAISILVGVEYNLVKLSKKSKPVTKIRVSKILKMTVKKRTKSLSTSEELCSILATEPGTATLEIEFEDNQVQTITLIAQKQPTSDKEPDLGDSQDAPLAELSLNELFTTANATYQVNSRKHTVTLKSFNNKKVTSYTIPASVKKNGIRYQITKIGTKAFSGKKKLTTIKISKSVASIGSKAFYQCTNLKTIKVPKRQLKAYKALLKKRGVRSSVKIVGY